MRYSLTGKGYTIRLWVVDMAPINELRLETLERDIESLVADLMNDLWDRKSAT